MHTDRKTIVESICEHKLDFNQYFLLQLLYNNDVDLIYQANKLVEPFKGSYVIDLMDRGFIRNDRKDGKVFIDEISPVMKKCEEIFGPLESLGQEFWGIYPDDMYINGRPVSTKSCDKEDFIANYDRKITKPVHKRILKALEYENQVGVRMGIEKWFKSEQWIEIEKKHNTKPNSSKEHVFGS